MAVKDQDLGRLRVMCTRAKEAGACSNRRPYRLDKIEELTVAGLKERMKDKAALAYFVKVFNAEREALAAGAVNRYARVSTRLRQAEQELERTMGFAIKGIISEEEAGRQLPTLCSEKARLERELALAEKPPQVVSLHPAALDHYRKSIDRLDAALRGGEIGGEEARQALRDMVTTVTAHPPSADNTIRIQVDGHLAALIGATRSPDVLSGGIDGSGGGS